jgi:ribosomal protein S12
MYKNIKIRYQRGKKETNETSDTIDTHTQKKTIVVLSSSIKKIDMLKENSYVFTNGIHKKKDR